MYEMKKKKKRWSEDVGYLHHPVARNCRPKGFEGEYPQGIAASDTVVEGVGRNMDESDDVSDEEEEGTVPLVVSQPNLQRASEGDA